MPFPHLFWPYWWVINTRHVFNSLNNIYWILRVFYRNLMWNWNFPTFFLDLEYIVWKNFFVPASSFLGKFGWSLYFFSYFFFYINVPNGDSPTPSATFIDSFASRMHVTRLSCLKVVYFCPAQDKNKKIIFLSTTSSMAGNIPLYSLCKCLKLDDVSRRPTLLNRLPNSTSIKLS